MALKASDIQKKLPDGGKKNCKECGFPTCFAFAMKLAAGAISVHKCTYLSEEIKVELEEALAPPIRLVTIGVGENALSIGEEEVIYRMRRPFTGLLESPSSSLTKKKKAPSLGKLRR